jgi:nucleotide-binding universal stress UspA family protein
MIKSILVALDGSEHAQAASRYAIWLADRMQATVVGLHVVDVVSIEGSGSFLHDVSGSLGFEPYLDFSSKMREVLHERGRTLLDGFLESCREEGVRADSRLVTGIVANEVCEHARTADLVLVGHRGLNERFSTGLLGSTTESVARKCPKPVLVVPIEFQPITRPLLAYDGSQRAAAAMHHAHARGGAELRDLLPGGRRVPGAHGLRQRGHRRRDDRGRPRPALHRRLRPQPHHRDGPRQHYRVRAAQHHRPRLPLPLNARRPAAPRDATGR